METGTPEANPADQPTGPAVHHVALRIPPFWPEKPALWFAQLESQFELSAITRDVTKFNYVVGNLEARYATEVEDIITNPPATNKYTKIKTEIIRRLSTSHEERIRQLLSHEEMGDRKPSQFLRHLRTLAGPTIPSDFLRTLWANRLPSNVQAIIACQANAALENVAELADRIMEVTPPHHSASVAEPTSEIAALTKKIEQLAQRMDTLTTQRRSTRSPRPHFRSRSHSRS